LSEEPAPAVQRQAEPGGVDPKDEEELLQRQALDQERDEVGRIQVKPLRAAAANLGSGLEGRIRGLQGGGAPLSSGERSFFEPRMGTDLRVVRVHTNAAAQEMAGNLHARAFTRGTDIVFGAGEYQPGTDSGRRLLGHELTHVVQQNRGNPELTGRIQRDANTQVRVTSTGSCSVEQGNVFMRAIHRALIWLRLAIQRLNHYIALPLSATGDFVRRSLDLHFHTHSVFHAGLIRDRLRAILTDSPRQRNFAMQCAPQNDPVCGSFGAYGYTRPGGRRGIRWCPRFFRGGAIYQVRMIIHETAHHFARRVGTAGHVGDRAYFKDRAYAFLRPEEAMDNADSFAMFCQDIGMWRHHIPPGFTMDTFSDCRPNQRNQVRLALARAERWNVNALDVTTDTRPAVINAYAGLRRTHIGSDNPARIPRLRRVYQRVRRLLQARIPFECEGAGIPCVGNTFGYYYHFLWWTSDVLHLCPYWFAIADDSDRIEALYILALRRYGDLSERDAQRYAALGRALSERYWPAPASLPSEPFPESTIPGTAIA
jgi:hypothetical protein